MTTLREIYTPKSGETDAENLRYIFSEEFNINTVQGYDPTEIHKTIEINDINTCQYDKDDIIKPKDIESNPLTLQQQNTFNDLYAYVHMLQENSNPDFVEKEIITDGAENFYKRSDDYHNDKIPEVYIFKKYFFNTDDKGKIFYIEKKSHGSRSSTDVLVHLY